MSTWVSSSYHELIQNAFSNHILYNKHNHKLSTNMTFCSYELISYFQASFLRKTKITNWALKWLFVLMNCYNIHFYVTFFENNWNHKLKNSVTNWISILFQTTNWALVWLFVLMNWFKMYFLGSFWEKRKLQIEPLYDFLISWTDPICILS